MIIETNQKTEKKWKTRFELPAAQKLNLEFDPHKLLQALNEFQDSKTWDGLGSEYLKLCETHRQLPGKFFKEEELNDPSCVCDMDWQKASYQQLSLTRWSGSFDLNQRLEKSQSSWDGRVAKGDPKADERWYRQRIEDLPHYFHSVLDQLGEGVAHRARFAKLKAGARIKPHIDYDTTYSIRIHIPIITNSKCWFGAMDKTGQEQHFHMPADGSVWFINPGIKHWVANEGDSDRIHLIVSVDSQKLLEN